MSLCINTTTPEGMVLAADSRQSYRNQKGMSRIGSDSASKIFRLGKRIGVTVAGLAFLPENGVMKNISRFVDEFKSAQIIDDMTVMDVSKKLKNFFEEKYQYKKELEALPARIEADLQRQGCTVHEIKVSDGRVIFQFTDAKGTRRDGIAGVDQLQFMVAGFNPDDSHQVCIVYVPGEIETKRDSTKKGGEYGASWIGQIDVVSRIVLGFDGRIGALPMLQQAAAQIGGDNVKQQLSSLEYAIQWGTMTLQDGIDFSVLAIETTNAMQRFSDGIRGDPGDMPGVGGAVDVAVITKEKGLVWISKKRLRAGEVEVDLENLPALSVESTQQ